MFFLGRHPSVAALRGAGAGRKLSAVSHEAGLIPAVAP